MRLFIFIITFFICQGIYGQDKLVFGYIKDNVTLSPVSDVEIYEKNGSVLSVSNDSGYYYFYTSQNKIEITFFSSSHHIVEEYFFINDSLRIDKMMTPLTLTLDVVNINAEKEAFKIKSLSDVIETSVYAGKKSEVVLLNSSDANLASNNARQIYARVSGLNIYENDDAGLQLNIGGRGLDPNRTSNFNTRQNGYDISADVLGYPESYYTPPSEALQEIQIIRGASSLQYGTQFGGLVNFLIKKPNLNKKLDVISRNTVGSNDLFTNFTSFSGNSHPISYYSFINYKKGSGFRPNSDFESNNIYSFLECSLTPSIIVSTEVTYLDYLAQQAGGLTDEMFYQNPDQSNRSRNWFEVNWLLYNFKIRHNIDINTTYTFNVFGLDASRYALGFRSNRVGQIDPLNERDLIKGDFNNIGAEFKLLHNYKLFKKDMVSLVGYKLYKSDNISEQGPGSDSSGPDFSFAYDEYPYYLNQSRYNYPNTNIAVFSESIFYINNKLSIIPGCRYESINTGSDGFYKKIFLDGASNPILDTTIFDTRNNVRNFILFGTGITYKTNKNSQLYTNLSQNYRSVTFSDISIVNPAFTINPDIKDENGYTLDFGIRGEVSNIVYYDITCFKLKYNDRIGFIQKVAEDGNVKSERGNVGDANIVGLESLLEFNFQPFLTEHYTLNTYINTSFITSEYVKSDVNGVQGNKVEFIPSTNIKTGLKIGYKNITTSLQYTYVSEQYTDASNAIESNLSGVIGLIPTYNILDLGLSINMYRCNIETGINNLLDSSYFTRRATGYPGPGIIPSQMRHYYITLEFNI